MSEKLNKARNNQGIKGETDYVLGLLEKDQISNESEKGTDFAVQTEADKESTLGYGKLDTMSDGNMPKAETEFPEAPSMARFAKKHEVITTKDNTLRDVLQQSTDSPADSGSE